MVLTQRRDEQHRLCQSLLRENRSSGRDTERLRERILGASDNVGT